MKTEYQVLVYGPCDVMEVHVFATLSQAIAFREAYGPPEMTWDGQLTHKSWLREVHRYDPIEAKPKKPTRPKDVKR